MNTQTPSITPGNLISGVTAYLAELTHDYSAGTTSENRLAALYRAHGQDATDYEIKTQLSAIQEGKEEELENHRRAAFDRLYNGPVHPWSQE